MGRKTICLSYCTFFFSDGYCLLHCMQIFQNIWVVVNENCNTFIRLNETERPNSVFAGGSFSCSNYAVVNHMQFLWGDLEHGQLTGKSGLINWVDHVNCRCEEFLKLIFRASALRQKKRLRAIVWKVNFKNSPRWPIYINKSGNKPNYLEF